MQQLPVSALMRDCSFAVVGETTRLRDAAEILITHGHPVLVAEDAAGRMCGVIPEAAVIRLLMATTSREETVASILSRHVESIRENALLDSVLHLFRASCHAVIPVVNDAGHVVGLLHRHDVVRMLLTDAAPNSGATPETPRPHGQKPHFLDPNTPRRNAHGNNGATPDERQA